MTKPWLIYTRVSTQDQAQEGASLPAQEEACRHYLHAQRVPVVELVSDPGLSGKDLHRPGIQSVLERVRRGEVAGVIAWKLDRFTRSLRDLLDVVELLDKHQVALASVQERIDTSGPMGRFIIALMGALAQLEREQIGERTSLAMQQRLRDGCWVGGHVPAGLQVVDGADGRRRLERHPHHGPAVAECWPMASGGASLREIAQYLNDAQVPTRRGGPWSTATTSQLLRNVRYVGLVVDQDTFDGAALALADRATAMQRRTIPPGGRPTDRVWPLAGLVVCGHCGRAMVGTQARGRAGRLYPYLRCTGKAKRLCNARDLPADTYEGFMLDQLAAQVSDGQAMLAHFQALADQVSAKANAEGPALEQHRTRARALRHRLDQLVEISLEEAGPAARAYAPKISSTQVDLEAVEIAIAKLEATQAAAATSQQHVAEWVELLRQGFGRCRDLAPPELARLLQGTIRQVRLTDALVEIDLWCQAPANETAGAIASPGGSVRPGLVRTQAQSWLPGGGGLRTWATLAFPLSDCRGRRRVLTLVSDGAGQEVLPGGAGGAGHHDGAVGGAARDRGVGPGQGAGT